jgi:hypothetical protein
MEGLLEKVTGDYVFKALKVLHSFLCLKDLEVMEIGTGFMMVKREVYQFEKQSQN